MRNRRVLLVLMLLFAGSAARADMGTSLMLLPMAQLIFLNWVIALVEAAVVWKVFHVEFDYAAGWLLGANYFSFFAGFALLACLDAISGSFPGDYILRYGTALLGAAVAVSYLLTILLEWPFCRPLARWAIHPWRRALGLSLVAQTVSYAILIPLYVSASPTTFLTEARLQSAASFASPPVATVYFVGKDNAVWKVSSDGSGRRRTEIPSLASSEVLWIGRNGDLCAVTNAEGSGSKHHLRPLVKGFGVRASYVDGNGRRERLEFDDWSFLTPAELRPIHDRDWDIGMDVFAGRGLTVSDGHSRYNLALETPYLAWTPQFATLLPSDLAVFQLGPSIVILDMPTKRLAVLAEGRCPVVVLKPVTRHLTPVTR